MIRKHLKHLPVALALLGFVLLMIFGGPRSALVDEPAPSFTLPIVYQPDGTLGSERVRLSDLKGSVVVLDFWASWCAPCQESVPAMNRVAAKYKARDVAFLGINTENQPESRIAWVAQSWRFGYPVVVDGGMQAQRAYAVEAYPTLFVIDRTQTVRFVHFGAPSAAELSQEIESRLE
jgi:cytochrome c biogenesis protein CcmG/thiol:disulfide interchange protein DsbE